MDGFRYIQSFVTDDYGYDGPKINLIALYVLYKNNGIHIDEFYWDKTRSAIGLNIFY